MLSGVLFVIAFSDVVLATCPCNGVEVAEQDQMHCWEVIVGVENGWVAADNACQQIGGHLGHPQNAYTDIVNYVKTIYKQPVLTGIVVGNVEQQRFGIMCPNNNFFGLLNQNESAVIVGENATGMSTCSYLTDSDYKLHFASCGTSADVLCDRPMEKADYCNIVMNCTTTTQKITPFSSPTTVSIAAVQEETTVFTDSTTEIVSNTITASYSAYQSTQSINLNNSTSNTTTTTVKTPNVTTASTNISGQIITTTTTSSSCTKVGCGSNEWRIFGMCVDWRFLLLLLALLLLMCCSCWILHCCFSCCMWCKTRKSPKKTQDPTIHKPRDIVKAASPIKDQIVSYSPEPDIVMPPPAAVTSPSVVIPISEDVYPKRHSVFGIYTREIRMMYPEKPVCKDAGVNTDPWQPTSQEPIMVKPAKLKKKKPKTVRPSSVQHYDDIADEVSIKFNRTPTPDQESSDPEGDEGFVFQQNSRPQLLPENGRPVQPRENGKKTIPPTVISMIGNPRKINSPPPREKTVFLKNDDNQPKNSRSPTYSSDKDEPQKTVPPRFPSPPRKKENRKGNPLISTNRGEPQHEPHSRNEPVAGGFAQKPSLPVVPLTERGSKLDSPKQIKRNRSFSPDSFTRSKREREASPRPVQPLMQKPDVSIRAARGKLGGVVKAGGNGTNENIPTGWKPWAKTTNSFSRNSQPF